MELRVRRTGSPCTVKINPLPWQVLGLSETRTGYGSKLTTRYMVKLPGDKIFRRVYMVQYSNSGTPYVVVKGQREYLY